MGQKYEPYLHAVSICWPLMVGFIVLGMDVINAGEPCYIHSHPKGCEGDDSEDCERGNNEMLLRNTLHLPPLMISLLIMATTMIMTYLSVLEQERTSQSYRLPIQRPGPDSEDRRESWVVLRNRMKAQSSSTGTQSSLSTNGSRGGNNQNRGIVQVRRSRLVMNQAMAYVGAFLLVFIFPLIFFMGQSAGATEKSLYVVFALSQIIYPLQGFFNLLVYLQPKMSRIRREDQSIGYLGVFWFCLKPEDPASSRPQRGFRSGRHGSCTTHTTLQRALQTEGEEVKLGSRQEIHQGAEEDVRPLSTLMVCEETKRITSRQPEQTRIDYKLEDIPTSQSDERKSIMLTSHKEKVIKSNTEKKKQCDDEGISENRMEKIEEESEEETA